MTTQNRPMYTARIERDPESSYWLAELGKEQRCHTFGRTLAQVREMIRDAAATWYDVDPDSFDLRFEVVLPGDAVAQAAQVRARHQQLRSAEREVVTDLRVTARRLTGELGLSMRDAADLLGISHQRVAQLVRQAS
ncbi:MAG: type II toxin-antitoxin system HicB family antitoxin [Stenotrophomonas sp.]|uniref:type II toxin-antitoxin system HicB family antitoxin n=1 Tax=Stenotrophomonas sp. TaxID=69392 RepID=UPI003D6D2A18